ncbi:uncharacterized protein BT62DRAFT_897935 [Guyanagaster necrorhizus]|uniref:Uncharacterized protein n=1 Tax=Guyanagaster necrorhizus TaxID=856835 RepID=A0A9P7VRP1_9AGAR|nr:uncharacterized protein BT62DRAFT_897935 [Guyanagaster necrorhizus MCA 3950]KAG7445230.1 hypothetical protein BT62DRAFT_897935 [Guyanagaster necrorhizus MCA 3950]
MSSLRRRIRPASHDFVLRRPPPSHRHSGPSAPWPWINLNDEVDDEQLKSEAPPIPELCNHVDCNGCWKGYPQSRFPNWTPSQVRRSRILYAIKEYDRTIPCTIHHVDVDDRGFFMDSGKKEATEQTKDDFWEHLIHHHRPTNTRVRALFVENMSGPVLQMLGAKYNIEPFFFSSSLSWIPSRFQEEVRPGRGDHITITLTFLKTMDAIVASDSTSSAASEDTLAPGEQVINTQAPLVLRSGDGCSLVLDLLAVHLIRNVEGNTLISYHNSDREATSAPYLHERIRFAGQSVYWQNIFQRSSDPTFVLLTFIWHAVYAWDEALEALYAHICWLEISVLEPSNIFLTRELHIIRAHHLHYSSLLEDMKKAVTFTRDTPNPAMDNVPEEEKQFSRTLLEKECRNLLSEIGRLEMSRRMQDKRLKNVMNLVFSSVNINDSKRMKELTEAAVRDSAAMKQIAYLTMIFLPSSFVAGIFGMNVREITGTPQMNGSLPYYFITAAPLTFLTIWIVMAFQSKYLIDSSATFWMRLVWPWLLYKKVFMTQKKKEKEDVSLDTFRDLGAK